jgi:type VI secretion system protein ImpA
MALPDGLLNPIPGDSPSGKNLRYDPILDKLKEARREEEILPQGAWTYEVKKADYSQVIKLATEALSARTKDLQIAAWLAEALVYRDRIEGLREGLDLLRGLMENFWDTLYPEMEDGDVELRIGPIEWVGTRLDGAVRKVPLTKNKLDWFKFQESRRVGYEADAQGNDAKLAARQEAIADKKCTAEEFDEAARLTGTAYYAQLTEQLAAALVSIDSLETLSDEKFGRDAPSFKNLRAAIDDLQTAVKQYYNPEAETAEEAPAEEESEETADGTEEALAAGGAPAKAKKKKALSEEPADREDAVQRLVRLAEFLRKENQRNPVPYLILRGVRWGELREGGTYLNLALLEAPPTELRQQVKKLSLEGQWGELIEAAESGMGMACGRGWLDLQRHVVRACENLGSDYEPVAAAIRGTLRALLGDYPDLINATLLDDTPVANPETQAWFNESIVPPPPAPPPTTAEPELIPEPVMQAATSSTEPQVPDVNEFATKAAKAGRVQEAIEMLMREIAQEKSGRTRFQRKIQVATLCLSTKHEAIAYPILAELADEIERRKLEEWEEAPVVAHPLALLYRCLDKMGNNEAEKQKIYQKLCRLDPVQALSCSR